MITTTPMRTILVMVFVAVGVTLTGAPALAKKKHCTALTVCNGTQRPDTLNGSAGTDYLYGKGSGDILRGKGGMDGLFGDLQADTSRDGADKLFGGADDDTLAGYGGNDLLDGGAGNDHIYAYEASLLNTGPIKPGTDTIKGGEGDDFIAADDGFKDVIACGGGADTVHFDKDLDEVAADCETLLPVS